MILIKARRREEHVLLVERAVHAAVAAGGERLAGVHEAVQADGGLLAGGDGVDGKLRAGVAVAADEDVRLRGLMAIPPVSEKKGDNLRYFAEMRNLFVDISEKKYDNVDMECLSMGMSGDYADAIAEGATMIRVGTAIFGPRNYNV